MQSATHAHWKRSQLNMRQVYQLLLRRCAAVDASPHQKTCMSVARLSPSTAGWVRKHLCGGIDFYHPERSFYHEVCDHLDPAAAMAESEESYWEMRNIMSELQLMLNACKHFSESFTMQGDDHVWPGAMKETRRALGRAVAPCYEPSPLDLPDPPDSWNSDGELDSDDENLLRPAVSEYLPVRPKSFLLEPGVILACHPNPILHRNMDYRRLVMITSVDEESGIQAVRLADRDKFSMGSDQNTRWEGWSYMKDPTLKEQEKFRAENPFYDRFIGGPHLMDKYFCLHNLTSEDLSSSSPPLVAPGTSVEELDGGHALPNSKCRFGRRTPDVLIKRANQLQGKGKFLRLVQGGLQWKPGELQEQIRQGMWVLTQGQDVDKLLGEHWHDCDNTGWMGMYTLLGETVCAEYMDFIQRDICVLKNVDHSTQGGNL